MILDSGYVTRCCNVGSRLDSIWKEAGTCLFQGATSPAGFTLQAWDIVVSCFEKKKNEIAPARNTRLTKDRTVEWPFPGTRKLKFQCLKNRVTTLNFGHWSCCKWKVVFLCPCYQFAQCWRTIKLERAWWAVCTPNQCDPWQTWHQEIGGVKLFFAVRDASPMFFGAFADGLIPYISSDRVVCVMLPEKWVVF